MNTIKLYGIAAMSENRVIGRNNKLIWHLPEDLKHFKKITMGCPLVMGRKSFDSLPGILPGRTHIVISRQEREDDVNTPRVKFVTSTQEALKTAHQVAHAHGVEKIFVAGGGEIYRQMLPDIERLYLTIIHQDYDGDTLFPQLDWEAWHITDTKEFESEDHERPSFTIMTLDRSNR